MAGTIFLIAVLLACAMALIVVEICTPTFGVLAVTAVGCIGWAMYLVFGLSNVAGVITTIVVVILLPVYVVVAIKVMPKTLLGRLLYRNRKVVAPGEGTPEVDVLCGLVGRTTSAETVLRPSGTIRLDGNRIVAQAESGMIEQGEQVKVIKAAGTHVIVRKMQDS